MQQEISATVIIKSPDEQVSSRGPISPRQARLGDYLPDLQTVIDTARYFRDAGFKVMPNPNRIDISGSVLQFESMFGLTMHQGVDTSGVGYERVPASLQDILVRIIFPHTWG